MIQLSEDRDAIKRFVKGNTQYDYATNGGGYTQPIYNTHPMATVSRRDIGHARSSKLVWNPKMNRRSINGKA